MRQGHGAVAAGRGLLLTVVLPLYTTDTLQAWALLPSGGTLGTETCLTIQRLSDLPEHVARA